MKNIKWLLVISLVIMTSLLYIYNQREHNYLGYVEPQLSNSDSLIRSYYTYDLMSTRHRIPSFLCDSIKVSVSSIQYRNMVNIIEDHNRKLLMREAPLHPEIFWDGLYKIRFCDSYWRGKIFDFGIPDYYINNIKGIATLELMLSDSVKCCNKQDALGASIDITLDESITTIEEMVDEIIGYYEQKGNNYFYPIDIPLDTTLSMVSRVFLFKNSNPSRMINKNEARIKIINQLQKLSAKNKNKIKQKYSIESQLKRVTQSRRLILRMNYDGEIQFQHDFKCGHEVQALGYELDIVKIE